MEERCKECPVKGPELSCPRWPTNHTRYCGWVDPKSPTFRVKGKADIMRIAVKQTERTRNPPYFPSQPPSFVDQPTQPGVFSLASDPPLPFGPSVAMFDDEETHNKVYRAAVECPHRIESKDCCQPDKCGSEGAKAGSKINIGDCYACSAERLGL